MSLVHFNDIEHFCRTKRFLKNAEVILITCYNTFKGSQTSLKFYPKYDHMLFVLNPLWYSQTLPQDVVKVSAFIAF